VFITEITDKFIQELDILQAYNTLADLGHMLWMGKEVSLLSPEAQP
jgi:hypothetical protein